MILRPPALSGLVSGKRLAFATLATNEHAVHMSAAFGSVGVLLWGTHIWQFSHPPLRRQSPRWLTMSFLILTAPRLP